MKMASRDVPTYPEHGVIYQGDYLDDIPYDAYVHAMPLPAKNVYDIRRFGARPNTKELSTQAFQDAARSAKETNGIILVTGGTYLVGSVEISSGTTLFISKDATLKASRDLSQFSTAMISIIKAENVLITGGGTIDGSGEYFVNLPRKKPLREPLAYTKLPPRLLEPLGYPEDTIRFAYRERIRYADDRWNTGAPDIKRPLYTVWLRDSRNIRVENILMKDSFDWTVSIDCSMFVTVRDVVVDNNRHIANTDGIDVMGSTDVTVSHVFISTADDGLCVKSPLFQGHDGLAVTDHTPLKMSGTRHITFEDCKVCTVMNAFKIGTETYYDIDDITVKDCSFFMPDLYPGSVSGISIESADGAVVSNVRCKNIQMNNVVCPLFICINKRNKYDFANAKDALLKKDGGSVEHICLENISAVNMEIPCIITGYSTHQHTQMVKDVCISSFHATYRQNREILDIRYPLYENIHDYPESNAFGDVPAYGIFFRHLDGLRLSDVSIKPREVNTRQEFVFDDCHHCIQDNERSTKDSLCGDVNEGEKNRRS
jgi:polygalacturonase